MEKMEREKEERNEKKKGGKAKLFFKNLL